MLLRDGNDKLVAVRHDQMPVVVRFYTQGSVVGQFFDIIHQYIMAVRKRMFTGGKNGIVIRRHKLIALVY